MTNNSDRQAVARHRRAMAAIRRAVENEPPVMSACRRIFTAEAERRRAAAVASHESGGAGRFTGRFWE